MSNNSEKTGESSSQRLIHRFDKSSLEEVRAVLQEWRNQTYLDLRIWMKGNPGEPGGETPTKKGITLNVDLLGELKKVVDAALAEVELGEKPGKVGEIPEKASKV